MPKATGKTKGCGCMSLVMGLLLVGFMGSVCNSTGSTGQQMDSATPGTQAMSQRAAGAVQVASQRVATATVRPTRTIRRTRPTLLKVSTVRPGTAYPTPTKKASVTATQAPLGVAYVADVTVPDDSVFAPGSEFVKTWRLKNTGTAAWPEGTVLKWAGKEQMGAPETVTVVPVEPGATVDVSVPMIAPEETGRHRGDWRMCFGEVCFGTVIYAQMVTQVEQAPTDVPPTAPVRLVVPTVTVAPAPAAPVIERRHCCKICTTGKACGDTCISRSYTCRKGPGCACNGY